MDEFSYKVIEADKEDIIKKIINKFNMARDEKPEITELITKIHDQVKNIE